MRQNLTKGYKLDGLGQRFQLMCYPDDPGSWRNVDRWPDSEAKTMAYELVDRLVNLDAAELGAEYDEREGLSFLRFESDAQELYFEWLTGLENDLRSDKYHPALESHFSKYRSLIPSLALICHLANGGSGPVSLDALQQALAWGEYLTNHTERIYNLGLTHDVSSAKALVKKIQQGELDLPFTIRSVYRKGWTGLNSPKLAENAVELLEDLNIVQRQTLQTGGRSSEVFECHPKLLGA